MRQTLPFTMSIGDLLEGSTVSRCRDGVEGSTDSNGRQGGAQYQPYEALHRLEGCVNNVKVEISACGVDRSIIRVYISFPGPDSMVCRIDHDLNDLKGFDINPYFKADTTFPSEPILLFPNLFNVLNLLRKCVSIEIFCNTYSQ